MLTSSVTPILHSMSTTKTMPASKTVLQPPTLPATDLLQILPSSSSLPPRHAALPNLDGSIAPLVLVFLPLALPPLPELTSGMPTMLRLEPVRWIVSWHPAPPLVEESSPTLPESPFTTTRMHAALPSLDGRILPSALAVLPEDIVESSTCLIKTMLA